MIGQSFGNYRVTGLIGEGGMGIVYAAEHPSIGRRAAVKVLRPGLTENAELTRRFFNEARAANAIRHPGIVEVFDSGTLPSGVSYIVMELLEGESLAARLHRIGRFGADETRRIGGQTASALAAAHAAGIIHRDLKPDNLFLVPDYRDNSSENVKVLDFGIAKLGLDTSRSVSVKTRTGSVMGTPAYMSPEQCRGTKEVDHRADIYAMGVILYEMLVGHAPFVSDGFGEMVHLHISAAPPPPRSHVPSVPSDLEELILRCLAKDPDDRPQSMSAVEEALLGRAPPMPRVTVSASLASGLPGSGPVSAPTTFTQAAHAVDLRTDVIRGSRRRVVVVALGGLAVAGGALLWRMPSATPEPAPTPAVSRTTIAAPVSTEKRSITVQAAIVSDPSGARVVREKDGAVIGMTPFREAWPRADGIKKLRLELDGYRSESVVVPLDRGVDLSFSLKKISSLEPARRRDRPTKEVRRSAVTPTRPTAVPASPTSGKPAAPPSPPATKPEQKPRPEPEPVPI